MNQTLAKVDERRPMPWNVVWQHIVDIAHISNKSVEALGALEGLARSALPGIDQGTRYRS